MDDLDPGIGKVEAFEFLLDAGFIPDKKQLGEELVLSKCKDCTLYEVSGCVIAAHGV
jgi:hypothetical protein